MKKNSILKSFFTVLLFSLFMNATATFGQTAQDSSITVQDTSSSVQDSSMQDAAPSLQDTSTLEHFEPIEDRWRDIIPPPGSILNPYQRNVLKGDYPIIGQSTFFVFTGTIFNTVEYSTNPTPIGISTERPVSPSFFGDEQRFFNSSNLKLTFELYKGDAAFKPRDYELKVTAVLNYNYLSTQENNNVNINPRKGPTRSDTHIGFQELSFEKHLFDLNDRFDFISTRLGIQLLNTDFRGFIFNDFNLGARFFGSAGNNKYQYNLAYFRMLEKDTNSELNTIFEDREQDVFVANLYKQDFLTLGYTTQFSLHYNHDKPSVRFNTNGFPVRPAVLGNVAPHDVKAYYIGWASDGHFGRINVNHAVYQAFGKDSFNSFANQELDINAQMAALELSIDVDWMRFKISGFYSSGDSDPMDGTGKGFDTIFDFPFFAGGKFSYWNQQAIRLQGVALVNKFSLVPNLRSDKIQGQANFVNPGLWIANLGYDMELTPKFKSIMNFNFLRFVNTASLEHFTNQNSIRNNIGLDYSLGLQYRPLLNNNIIFEFGASALTPMDGFSDLYETTATRYSFFMDLILTY